MRTDISQVIIQKTSDRLQSPDHNSEPKLSLVVSRKEVLLDDFSFTERRRVRRTTSNSITDVGIAICHPKLNHEDEDVWISYIRNGKVYIRHSKTSGTVRDIDWDELDIGAPSGTKCDVGFIATAQINMRGVTEYITGRKPLVFFIQNSNVMYIDTSDTGFVPHILFSVAVKDISVRQTPLGLGIFYVKTAQATKVYYRIYNNGSWGSENVVTDDMSATIEGLSTFNTLDGFGVQAYANGKLFRIVADEEFTFGTWFEVGNATGTGAIVEYYNGIKEAFFDSDIEESTGEEGGFCYNEANENWFFNSSKKFYSRRYSIIDFDHTNRGTVYFTTLLHGSENDIIYFIRYVYAKDVSSYTDNVTKTLQTDNPITQINAELKNIDDSLFMYDSTLFAPSAMLSLGVKYGDSEIVNLGIAYIDQATFEHGGEIALSGRNKTGVYLRDQTFEEEMELNETPSLMVEELMDIFDIDDYEVDTSADGTFENPNIITLMVEAKTNGMKAFQTLNDLLSDNTAGKKWDFEELPDGKIIVGYDEFRSHFNPKSSYIFNGMNDCFAKTVDRSIDGVYTKVRCTGTTPKGKDISYTYNVTNFRFWNAGENRIYHAPHVDGISKTELKKYAKALAKQLKYIGRVITYRMNLKPQLIIGDVAKITHGQEEGEVEQLGSITEIVHSLGSKGYFTEFTITSGGDVTDVSPTVTYVADKSIKGTNRKRRMSDYFGSSGGAGETSISTIINNGDTVNLPELIRNLGMRVLDEPTGIDIKYDAQNNTIKIKWTDPDDITTYAPIPVEWLGTVVVRNENGAPLHRWDGLVIVDETVKDTYKTEYLVDNTDIKKGTTYYYAIMPYHRALDDAEHPINHYRWTKVVSITAGSDLEPATITGVSVDGTTVNLTLSIPTLASGSYESITLVAKKNGTPLSVDDGDRFVTLSEASTSAEVSGLDELSHYYFVIFIEDDQGNAASSEPKDIVTGEVLIPPEYEYILNVNNLWQNEYEWLNTDYVVWSSFQGCYFPIDRKSVSLVSSDFETPNAHISNSGSVPANQYDVYPCDSIVTIQLTEENGLYNVSYSNYNMMENVDNYFKEAPTLSNRGKPLTNYWNQHIYMRVVEQKSIEKPIQSSFEDLGTALHYIYQHYANVNLYVDGHKWVSVD